MIKEILKKFATRIVYILFSLMLSIALWMYVEITENDMQTLEISDVHIELLNMELLHDRDLLVSSIYTENLSLTFEGSRSNISRLAVEGAVTVEVDLENIRQMGFASPIYNVILPSSVNANDVSIVGRSASRITLYIDRIFSKNIEVRTNYTGGTASDDLIADIPVIDPQSITVRGPEEIVLRISHAFVPIVRENLSSTYQAELPFVLYDTDNEIIEQSILDTLVLYQDQIHITIPIVQVKTIFLHVELLHGITTSETNTETVISPGEITVSGDPELLKDLNIIHIGNIDMQSFGTTSQPREFPIRIPNYITNLSGETFATAQVRTSGLAATAFSVTNIQPINIPPGYNIEFITQSIDVRVRGTQNALNMITPMNFSIIADFSEITSTGFASITVNPAIVGTNAEIEVVAPLASSEYRVNARVSEEESESP
ncbi:MAG: hypothetical protein FWH17_05840 [Oscillospiraceae bacterium]|nr:hypothetical protein [Oscillospiraceae bacterium]